MKRILTTAVLPLAAACLTALPAAAASNSTGAVKPAAASAAASTLPAGVAARVNGVNIPTSQLDAAVRATGQQDSPALRAALKNELITREVLRQAALKAHYDTHADVQAAVEQAKIVAMSQAYLRDTAKPVPVTDTEVKARYDAITSTLGDTEYQPAVIEVDDAATAQRIVGELKKGADFAQLAKQNSKGPNAAQGGLLNWVSFKQPVTEGNTQGWPLPLAQALLKLPDHGVSSAPVAANGKFYILKAAQKRPTQIPKYDDVKAALRRQLEQAAQQQAVTQTVGGLLKAAQIQQ